MNIKTIIYIIEALFFFYAAWAIFSYYSGRKTLSEEKENRRKRMILKYGWFLKISPILLIVIGLALLRVAMLQ